MARASLQCLVTMRKDGQPRSRATLSARGFTLVELAIVVAIVGVLAVIAVVGYRKLVTSSKVTEARSMLQGIRVAQEAYKAERGVYVNIGTQGCPEPDITKTGKQKTQWNPGCTAGGTNSWALLAVHADGPVQFQYMTIAGVGGSPAGLGDGWVGGYANLAGTAASPRAWYIAAAMANLDNNDSTAPTELVTTSNAGDIYIRNEGQ